MAKKKKHNRKKSSYKAQHKKSLQRAEGGAIESKTATGAASMPSVAKKADPAAKQVAESKVSAPHNSEIDAVVARRARREVRHSVILAGLIMLGLVLLWSLFAYTSVGAQVYRWVRI